MYMYMFQLSFGLVGDGGESLHGYGMDGDTIHDRSMIEPPRLFFTFWASGLLLYYHSAPKKYRLYPQGLLNGLDARATTIPQPGHPSREPKKLWRIPTQRLQRSSFLVMTDVPLRDYDILLNRELRWSLWAILHGFGPYFRVGGCLASGWYWAL